jgi:hypothetical protein
LTCSATKRGLVEATKRLDTEGLTRRLRLRVIEACEEGLA